MEGFDIQAILNSKWGRLAVPFAAGVLLCGLIWGGMTFIGYQRPQESANGVWTDSATGLTWKLTDNGADVDWQGAVNYCAALKNVDFGGKRSWYPYAWHLAYASEISSLEVYSFWKNKGERPRLKGGFQFSSPGLIFWTATRTDEKLGPGTKSAIAFSLRDGGLGFLLAEPEKRDFRAICVFSPSPGALFWKTLNR